MLTYLNLVLLGSKRKGKINKNVNTKARLQTDGTVEKYNSRLSIRAKTLVKIFKRFNGWDVHVRQRRRNKFAVGLVHVSIV